MDKLDNLPVKRPPSLLEFVVAAVLAVGAVLTTQTLVDFPAGVDLAIICVVVVAGVYYTPTPPKS